MTLTLNIWTACEHLATLQWRDGQLATLACNDAYRGSVERWTSVGLVEWLKCDGLRVPRHTRPADPDILARLELHLRSFHEHRTFLASQGEVETSGCSDTHVWLEAPCLALK
jgi:hypothetical protein